MSIYDYTISNKVREILPPDKRTSGTKAFLNALIAVPMQWLSTLWLGDYRTGSTGMPWLDSTTYGKGERVTYKGSAYESKVSGNLNHGPLDTAYWLLVQENFIGVFERILYTGNYLTLTYALNKYFGTTYRQPNSTSDIYITVYPNTINVFVVGGSENNSSIAFADHSSEFVVNAYAFAAYFNMTIFVPVAVFEALDDNPDNRESIVRNFANKYIIAGVKYSVETY